MKAIVDAAAKEDEVEVALVVMMLRTSMIEGGLDALAAATALLIEQITFDTTSLLSLSKSLWGRLVTASLSLPSQALGCSGDCVAWAVERAGTGGRCCFVSTLNKTNKYNRDI